MARAFVAVVPPDSVLEAVTAAFGEPSIPGARLSRREQWHLTLQFLGNGVELDEVSDALGELWVAAGPVQLGGFGAFPNERRGRVLWLGVAEGGALLTQLVAAIGALLGPRGYPPEDRDHHPHLTLARWRVPADLRETVAALPSGAVGPAWVVDEVVLFESLTRSTGARYMERGRFRLAG
ncbi:MAG TPA: RNA 2',3'-cyclic phosphodiesterase [Acidimicrobiia bacterium]